MRRRTQRKVEATVQRILNEYPTESLERIQEWAAVGRLAHDWGSCLNAAAVGHPIPGPVTVQEEIGVPAFLAEGLALLWDRLGDIDACQRRTQQLVGEILASRDRLAPRCFTGQGPGAPMPAGERSPVAVKG